MIPLPLSGLRRLTRLVLPAMLALASLDAAPRVYRDRVDPHWLGETGKDAARFWYRVDTGLGRAEFILVDADQGTRAPAFDHARAAAALTRLIGKPVEAHALPVESLDFSDDGAQVVLQSRTKAWRLDLASYELTEGGPASGAGEGLRPRRDIRPSRSGGEPSGIIFVNRRETEVELHWIDQSGERRSYGTLKPGDERDQNTYAGHAWLITAKNGDSLAVFVAEDRPAVASITDTFDFSPSRSQRAARDAVRRPREDRPEGVRSPDGRWEVVVRGDNLALRDIRAGKEEPLTHDADALSSYARNVEARRAMEMEYDTREPERPEPEVYWSPDSRRFVAMRHTPSGQRRVTMVQSSPPDQLQPRLVTIPYLKPGDAVPYAKPRLFEVESRREIKVPDALFENPWSIGDVRWSADSGEFTFLFNQRGHQALRILGVDAATGAVRPVVDERSTTFICYSGKYFAEYLGETGEIIWMSERDGWNHLYLYDAKTGRVKNQITRGDWVVRDVQRVDREKRQVWFTASGLNAGEDPYHVHHYRVGFDGSGLVALTAGDGTHSVTYSPDRRYLLDTWSRVDLAPVTELRRVSDGSLVLRLEEADISELGADGWRAPERFAAKGRDGQTDIYGVIHRPKDFDPANKYPVLEDIYAGPQDSFAPKSFRPRHRSQDLADRGFIIVKLDGMGTSNRSKAFHDVAWKNIGDAGFPDRIAWIRAAAANRPEMDLSRVGLFGTSAGGQNALGGLLFHGDFYRAAVSDSACHDNRMDKIWWNEQWMGWPVDESYVRSSNVASASKLTGKLLLMVGELDKNVDPASTYQVVDALIRADKDFELLAVPNGGHGIAGTPYGARRMAEFFTRVFLTTPQQ